MKHFKNSAGDVFAFESDGSQDDFISDDLVAITDQEADELRFPPPTSEEVVAMLTTAVQELLDTTARTRNYDGMLSLCSYATSTHPTFSAEGQAGVEWRDAVWSACYQIMADVQADTRPVPTAEALIAELPKMVWP